MQYVRSLDHTPAAHLSDPSGIEVTVAAQLESVLALGCCYQPRCADPGWGAAAVDLLLVGVEGTLSVEVGGRVLTAGADCVVFVPAGAAHRVRNDGTEPARALALLVPAPSAGAALFEAVADDSGAAAGGGDGAFAVALDAAQFAAGSRPNGFAVQTLADPSLGVTGCVVNAAQVAAGGEGPPTHIHTFDQLFFVLHGRLHVEVALGRVVAERHQIVVLPAGVPHTQWNEGPDVEVHLAVLVPAPPAGEPLTVPVAFAAVPR
ncbi:MAG: cupin domain-containing protein [Acidimicrobiales bacterium]|nr:cupin domain-containing protein [Acidimicrobiales bacterium]